MKFFKITNLSNGFGQMDYKGIDISKNIPGSQVYNNDTTICISATTLDILPVNSDIQELTEAEYNTEKTTLEEEVGNIKQTNEQRMANLEDALIQAQNAINSLLGV